MRINEINLLSTNRHLGTTSKIKNKTNKNTFNTNSCTYFYTDNIKKTSLYKTVKFKGKTVHIIDGGIHATNMKYFAKFIKKDLNTVMHNVEINPKDRYTKQLKSLEKQLTLLNSKPINIDEYIAIPALASIPLLNLQDQYNKIMGKSETFTPENIKSKKNDLLKFLQKIYEHPNNYKKYINYMDPINQGIEHVYGIIEQINKLVNKNIRVYVPSGHPDDATLKWMAGERGLKPELYHYIATGEDINNSIQKMKDEIKANNWYNFNLLALSDANIVGIKDQSWKKDYIFAAYDSCITDSAKGTYNLTPLRKNEKIIGYSFSEVETNDYPFEVFPMNKEVSNLLKFVGKDKKSVLANDLEIQNFISKKHFTNEKNLLYPIEKIFTEKEIREYKITLQGKYVDSTLTLFFDENKEDKIIFKKCDCEGSGRPSVLSVWGSCYALFNAISRDIDTSDVYTESSFIEYLDTARYYKTRDSQKYETYLQKAVNAEKEIEKKGSNHSDRIEPYILLAEIYKEKKDYDAALGCLNRAMYIASNLFFKRNFENLMTLKKEYDYFINSKTASEKYDKEIQEYNELFFLEKLFTSKPTKPNIYNNYKYHLEKKNNYEFFVLNFIEIYKKIAQICELKDEKYPTRICKAAIKDLENCTNRGDEILKRQANKIQYIGDLYNEIKPN